MVHSWSMKSRITGSAMTSRVKDRLQGHVWQVLAHKNESPRNGKIDR